MIGDMLRRFVIPLLLIGAISGQTTQVPKVRIVFPKGHRAKASLTYALHDPADNDWEFVNRVSLQPGHSFLEISAKTDRFKALVWASGCQLKHFDVPIEKADVELHFACDPLKTVPFRGRVVGIKMRKNWRIAAAFVTLETLFWFQDYKVRLGSSPAPEISEIATAHVSRSGTFKIQLPDLSADPIASHQSFADLEFRITDGKRYHAVRPQKAKGVKTGGGGIEVAPSYPTEVTFK